MMELCRETNYCFMFHISKYYYCDRRCCPNNPEKEFPVIIRSNINFITDVKIKEIALNYLLNKRFK